MFYRLNKNINKRDQQARENGFSLIETVIAMTTLGVCLAYSMPLFLYAKLNNAKSEIRTGALMVSQRIFDDIRSRRFVDIPTYSASGANIEYLPRNTTAVELKRYCSGSVTINCINDDEKLQSKMMGRQYQAKVTYCELVDDCAENYRKFKIEVFYPTVDRNNPNNNKVYELEGTYTDFK